MPNLNTGRGWRKVHLTSSQQHFIENGKHLIAECLNATHISLSSVVLLVCEAMKKYYAKEWEFY